MCETVVALHRDVTLLLHFKCDSATAALHHNGWHLDKDPTGKALYSAQAGCLAASQYPSPASPPQCAHTCWTWPAVPAMLRTAAPPLGQIPCWLQGLQDQQEHLDCGQGQTQVLKCCWSLQQQLPGRCFVSGNRGPGRSRRCFLACCRGVCQPGLCMTRQTLRRLDQSRDAASWRTAD